MLTLLAPSERADAKAGRRHKLLTDWARQSMLSAALPLAAGRRIIFVGDASFAVHTLVHALARTPEGRATLISRLRLDASLFAPPAERHARTQGRPAQKGPTSSQALGLAHRSSNPLAAHPCPALVRQADREAAQDRQRDRPVVSPRHAATTDPLGAGPRPCRQASARQAFFSTDTTLAPDEIIAIFVRRWPVEVTFSEVRAHLGGETQRQWSDKAISRTTPALLGLYSLVTLWAEELLRQGAMPYAAAWNRKSAFTFTDAIAAVRRRIWIGDICDTSPSDREMPKIPPDRLIRMADALCFAA